MIVLSWFIWFWHKTVTPFKSERVNTYIPSFLFCLSHWEDMDAAPSMGRFKLIDGTGPPIFRGPQFSVTQYLFFFLVRPKSLNAGLANRPAIVDRSDRDRSSTRQCPRSSQAAGVCSRRAGCPWSISMIGVLDPEVSLTPLLADRSSCLPGKLQIDRATYYVPFSNL